MHKSLVEIAAAAGIGLATLAAPSAADARCFGCAVGVGVLGGVIAGAIVGNAIANNPPPPPPGYYAYPPPPPPGVAYGPPPAAYAELPPPPVGCHWGRRRVWVEGVGYQVRPVTVCR